MLKRRLFPAIVFRGAQEIINEYLEGKKRANQSTSARKRVSTTSAGRKSIAGRGESEGTVSTSASKRGKGGRKSDATTDESEDEKPAKSKLVASSKKSRNSPVPKKRKIEEVDAGEGSISPELYLDFGDQMKEKSWEHLVKAIDTVERHKNGLMVYFRT